MRRAYGVRANNPFWHYRLSSVAIIIGSVVLAMIAFVLQGVIVAAEQIIYRLLPELAELGPLLGLSRLVPGLVLLGALYMLFYSVTPSKISLRQMSEMAGRAACRLVVGRHHGAAAGRSEPARQLRSDLWQPGRGRHHALFLLADRFRDRDRRASERRSGGNRQARCKGVAVRGVREN